MDWWSLDLFDSEGDEVDSVWRAAWNVATAEPCARPAPADLQLIRGDQGR